MNGDSPTISIICCTHNRVQFVEQHYRALAQSLPKSVELIYALDHCTDGTLEFLTSVAQDNEQVTVVHNAGAPGLFSCRNFAIAHARGRFIHFLDDDDAVSEGFYAAIGEAISTGLDGDMFLTDMVLNREGEQLRRLQIIDRAVVPTSIEGAATIIEGELFDFVLNGQLYFNSANALIRRSLLEQHPFHAEIRKSSDWLLYLELSHLRPLRLVHLAAIHAIYFVHASSMSVASDKSFWNMKAFEALFQLVPPEHSHAQAVRRVFAKTLFDAGYAVRRQNKRDALRYYWRSARLGKPMPAMLAIAKLPLVW